MCVCLPILDLHKHHPTKNISQAWAKQELGLELEDLSIGHPLWGPASILPLRFSKRDGLEEKGLDEINASHKCKNQKTQIKAGRAT